MSGSFVLRSGVGTQMLIVSSSRTTAKSVVASSLPASRSALTSAVGDVGNVRAAFLDRLDLAGIEVDPGGVETRLPELDRERQTDVAEADDAGPGPAGLDLFEKRRGKC